MLKVTQQDPGGGSSSLLSTWHRVPPQWLQRLPKGAYSNFRKLQIADLGPRPVPPEERGWGLGAVCCDKLWEPAPHQVAQARRKSAGEKMRRPPEGGRWRDPERGLPGRPGLLLALISPKPTPPLCSEAFNSLDTTSCRFHLAFLFPPNHPTTAFLLLTRTSR